MSQDFHHEPVMVDEVVDLLGPVPPGLVLDATVGAGGHAAAILEDSSACPCSGSTAIPTPSPPPAARSSPSGIELS